MRSSSSEEEEEEEEGEGEEGVWVERAVKRDGEDAFVGPVPEIKVQATVTKKEYVTYNMHVAHCHDHLHVMIVAQFWPRPASW